MNNKEALSPSTLSNFTGTSEYYKHPLVRQLKLTEGVYYVSNNGLGWFVDIIATESLALFKAGHHFQTWKLTVKNAKGLITVEDGNYNAIKSKTIDFTDFPYSEISIWAIDGVLLLPSEY